MPKDSTVEDLNGLHGKARAARSKLEPVWFMNLAFYEGQQWLAWNGNHLYRPNMPKGKITVVDNRIMPAVRTEVAKMTMSRPVFTVTPRTADEEDTNAAQVAEQVMRFLWGHLNMQELNYKALFWSRITGAGFLKCYWDSTVGDSVEVLVSSQSGQVLQDATGRPMRAGTLPPLDGVVVKRVSQGDIKAEVRSPFQMFLDPLADSFPEAEWLIEESVKSPEYVRRRYNVDLTPDTPANPGLVSARMGGVFTPGSGAYKGVKVREYWSRPSSTHPNGRRAVWAVSGGDKKQQSTMLLEDDQPFDPMPYVMFSSIPVPGRMWPTSITEQLRGPQTELNKVKSQIAENRNRLGNPTIVVSKQAVQDPDKFAASVALPGGIAWIDDIGSPNAVPTHLQAPPLPDYVVEEIQRIEESIAQISGQHEVTSAQVPPGVTAASAINLLQEADNTQLGPSVADYEYQLGKFGGKLLQLAARYYTDARTIRLAGDNGAWQIFDFRGAMLRDSTEVEVQAGSAFPQSKAAKQAGMMDFLRMLAQSGTPLQGRQLADFLKDYEIGGAERFFGEYEVDELQCNRENLQLAQGVPLPINPYDNDEAHIANHSDFQKSASYQKISPQAKRLCELHVQAHRDRVEQQQEQQLQMQMRLQGNGPEEQQAQQQQAAQQQAQQQQQAQMQLELAHAQGQQRQDQAAQQLGVKAAQSEQQQGYQAASSEQSQRQAEELHQQKLRHQEERHQQELRRAHEQAEQQRRQGADQHGRKAA